MGPAPRSRATRQLDAGTYTLPGGLVLPSVTRILEATHSEEKRKALAAWRARLVAEHGEIEGLRIADKKREDGASRGAALHAAVRRKLRGLPTFGGVWLKSLERLLSQITRPLPLGDYGHDEDPEVAVPVWNELEGYAGTPDLVAEIDASDLIGGASRPSIAVFDWTSWDTAPPRAGAKRRTYRAEYSHDKQVQVAAYAKAIPLSHPDVCDRVDVGFAVIALPDKPAIVYVVDVEERYAEFCERLARFNAQQAELGRFDEAPHAAEVAS